jgi:methylmalonyl-CoA mutase C-terminal domain/subunit
MTHQRPLRVLIGKPGLDGHDKGAKVIAHTLRDAGCEVIYTGLHKTVDQIVEAALQEDVDIIGLSVLSGAHLDLTAKLMQRLQAEEMSDIVILIGGNIPHGDRPKLLELGANAVFPTASSLDDIVAFVTSIRPR